jgi:hypothetical protein
MVGGVVAVIPVMLASLGGGAVRVGGVVAVILVMLASLGTGETEESSGGGADEAKIGAES